MKNNTLKEAIKAYKKNNEWNAYVLIHISDFYDDNNKGYVFGVHYGTYESNDCSIDIEPYWFKTEKNRDIFIEKLIEKNFVHVEDIEN